MVRRHLLSAVGDLNYGDLGTTNATPTKNYSPFLWQPDDYYNNHKYHVYIYAGTNIGVDKRVTDWVLTDLLVTVHSAYSTACDATSKAEMHRIFTEVEMRSAINLSIEHLAGKYLVDLKDELTITLSADTYEYALPTSFLYLTKVTTEKVADGGVFESKDVIDPRDWSIIKAYPAQLKLDERVYKITVGKDLRLEGHGAQPLVTADTDTIFIPPDWLVQKAITFLPGEKIKSYGLQDTLRVALLGSVREPHAWPSPHARRVVE